MSKTKQILITGGPVHAYLDSVKIITNRFKGGLMAKMVSSFVKMAEEGDADVKVTYLCSKSSQQPWWDDFLGGEQTPHAVSVQHDGIEDYMEKVLQLAPAMDAVILGAAVANLIPKNKIKGKFPSHNYKEGDTIPIDFTIAPRIIDRVKKVAPQTHLFGFKLLADVEYDELINAAFGVLIESRATSVFANDAMDLMQKYIVCKDGSVHPVMNKELPQWILDRMEEKYYHTTYTSYYPPTGSRKIENIIEKYKSRFVEKHGMIFGSVAVRSGSSFMITGRGKKELSSITKVTHVDHASRRLWVDGPVKASLNAPLMDTIFKNYPQVSYIVHYHDHAYGLNKQPWASPGTLEDSQRPGSSFVIEKHGCVLSFDKKGNEVL